MPYEIVPDHEDCNSGEYALVQENTEELVGCHSSESEAENQRRAIQANKSDTMQLHNILVAPTFDEVKDLDDKGLFGGYLVKFGSPEKHDLEKDFFTKDTDFWLEDGEGKTAVLWGHGKDEHFGTKRLDKNWGKIVQKDAGLWMETQLQRRNEYEEMVHQLAKEGKLGLSSGTASHLVEREQSEKSEVTEIKRWPIGLDGTLTPTPAEPRIKVKPLKDVENKSVKEAALKVLGVDIPAGMGSTVDEMTVGQGSSNDVKATEEEIEERYEEFNDMVNMSASEIENWGEKECSDKASQNPSEVRNRVVDLLNTNKEDWGDSEYEDAGKVISFISRMRDNESGDPVTEGCPSKRDISLMNWGYDPTKDISVLLDEMIKHHKADAEDLSEGDYVRWDSSGGSAYGEIVEIGMGSELDPSTTDRTYETSEEEPGLLIALVDSTEDGVERRTEDGSMQTVYHNPDTVEKISKSDVKETSLSVARLAEMALKKIGDRDGTSESDENSGITSTLDELNNMV